MPLINKSSPTKENDMLFDVMVTQTWAYFHEQLDYPKSKRIKVHVLNPHSLFGLSYCGLENNDDNLEWTWEQISRMVNTMCIKCRRAAYLEYYAVSGLYQE